MPFGLQIAIQDSTEGTGPTTLCIPAIDHTTFFDYEKLKHYVISHSRYLTFILLILNSTDPNLSPALEELRYQANVFAIFICVKSKCQLQFNGGNVFPIAKQLITQNITWSAIQFFDQMSKRLLALNHIGAAWLIKQKAIDLKQQRPTNGKISGCHVLIIPLNTKDDNLFDFQQRLIDVCNDLCGDLDLTICTIYDYIPADSGSSFHENPDADAICSYIKKVSPIRIYLVGNEVYIPNASCKCMFDQELQDGDGYDTKYTFVENEPVNEQIKQKLAEELRPTWQPENMVVRRLEHLQSDIHFADALQRVSAILENLEMIADVILSREAVDHSETSVECSSQDHMIGDAFSGPTEQNGGSEIIDATINP